MQFFDFDLEDAINGTGFCPTKLDIYQDGKEYDALVKVVEFPSPPDGFVHLSQCEQTPGWDAMA